MHLKMKYRNTVLLPQFKKKDLGNSVHNKQGEERLYVKISSLEWIENEGWKAIWMMKCIFE